MLLVSIIIIVTFYLVPPQVSGTVLVIKKLTFSFKFFILGLLS